VRHAKAGTRSGAGRAALCLRRVEGARGTVRVAVLAARRPPGRACQHSTAGRTRVVVIVVTGGRGGWRRDRRRRRSAVVAAPPRGCRSSHDSKQGLPWRREEGNAPLGFSLQVDVNVA